MSQKYVQDFLTCVIVTSDSLSKLWMPNIFNWATLQVVSVNVILLKTKKYADGITMMVTLNMNILTKFLLNNNRIDHHINL